MNKGRVSWFNLHVWIPQKDIRKLIYAKLDYDDRTVVECAHNLHKEPTLNFAFSSFHCAHNGYINLLKWAIVKDCPIDKFTFAFAALGRQLEMLKYLHVIECPCDARTCNFAAENGDLHMLQCLRNWNCPWNEETCRNAAKNGHLSVLKWLLENGCPMNIEDCVNTKYENVRTWLIDTYSL